MKDKQVWSLIKRYWIVPLLILKSFFLAIVQLAWGLVSLGLLGWVIFFVRKEYPLVNLPDMTNFLNLGINFIMGNLNLFFWVFLITYFYFELRDLLKKEVQGE